MICVITITYQFFAQITPKPGKTYDISVSPCRFSVKTDIQQMVFMKNHKASNYRDGASLGSRQNGSGNIV